MGLFDGIREVLGMRAESDSGRAADPEDLFGLSTAYVTMAADLGYEPAGTAALCFAEVDSTDFSDTVTNVEDILEAGKIETGTEAEFRSDDHGYSWVVLDDPDFEDLVTSVHFAADEFIEGGYGSRLLAALFSFQKSDARGASNGGGEAAGNGEYVYWVYSFRRGTFYPFAPRKRKERDSSVEFKLESLLDGELDVEADKEYWYPLWPSQAGKHPWE